MISIQLVDKDDVPIDEIESPILFPLGSVIRLNNHIRYVRIISPPHVDYCPSTILATGKCPAFSLVCEILDEAEAEEIWRTSLLLIPKE